MSVILLYAESVSIMRLYQNQLRNICFAVGGLFLKEVIKMRDDLMTKIVTCSLDHCFCVFVVFLLFLRFFAKDIVCACLLRGLTSL